MNATTYPTAAIEAWQQAGRQHAKRRENSTWEVAWWLVEGYDRGFDPGFAYAQQLLQRSKSTIENYYRVGRAYPRGKQHPDLSFSTHRELLREPDENARALVLCLAIEKGWFANDVAKYFDEHPPSVRPLVGIDKDSRNPRRSPYVRKKRGDYLGAHVKCPCGCEHVFPVRGNKVAPHAVAPEVVEGGRADARGREAEPADVPIPGSSDSGSSGGAAA